MRGEPQDWNIGRTGRNWTGPEGLAKLERLPGRLELMFGKLCFNETERRALLGGLLENIGLDEAVQLGDLHDWQQAIAARAIAECGLQASKVTGTPTRHWDCRVIEFPSAQEIWCAIHEVYYEHGVPVAYSELPAVLGWSSEDEPDAGLDRLGKLKEALSKPFLKLSDFDGADTKADLQGGLGRMI